MKSSPKKVLFNGPVWRVEQDAGSVYLLDQFTDKGIASHTQTSELFDAISVFASALQGERVRLLRVDADPREEVPRTDEEIVRQANDLARLFYAMEGYRVEVGYRFDAARHPHERRCWKMACVAFEVLQQTDVEEALTGMKDVELE